MASDDLSRKRGKHQGHAGSHDPVVCRNTLLLLKGLKWAGAPTSFICFCFILLQCPHLDTLETFDSVEYFAGAAQYTRAVVTGGRNAVSYERNDDAELQDFLGGLGYCNAVLFAVRLIRGGQCVFAPVCSSWCWMNRYTSGRRPAWPLGNTRLASVDDANRMVTRVTLLLYILTLKAVFWVLEQPVNSLLERHPRFQQFMATHKIWRHCVHMLDYGAESSKPSWLYSNYEFINQIDRYKLKHECVGPRTQLVKQTVDAAGRRRISGTGALKSSQEYPPGFGAALDNVYKDNADEIMSRAKAHRRRIKKVEFSMEDMRVISKGSASWGDADLDDALASLLR